jgi:cytochrome c biogenesis factor
MTAAGELSLWAALLLSLWGAVSARLALSGPPARASALSESGGRAVWAVTLLLAVAVCGLAAALLTPDLSLEYVALSVSRNVPEWWRLGALMSRPAGALLVLVFLATTLGALAQRSGNTVFTARLCELLTASLAAIILAANPYARLPRALPDGLGLDPGWQIAVTPLARLAMIIAGAVAAVAVANTLARRDSRAWWRAASGVGALALVAALRRSFTGPGWGALEWSALAMWLAVTLWAHVGRGPSRLSAFLARAGAVIAIVSLAGFSMRAGHSAVVSSGASTEMRDPVGGSWRFTSEGLSSYDALNRHVRAVLFDVRRGAGRTRVVRPEWRRYVDETGDPVGDAASVNAVVNGPLTTVVIGLAMPPAGDDATLVVTFVPLFVWWWVAAALFVVSAAAGIRREGGA